MIMMMGIMIIIVIAIVIIVVIVIIVITFINVINTNMTYHGSVQKLLLFLLLRSPAISLGLTIVGDHLAGLVVKVFASGEEDPGFDSRLQRGFFGVESYQ